ARRLRRVRIHRRGRRGGDAARCGADQRARRPEDGRAVQPRRGGEEHHEGACRWYAAPAHDRRHRSMSDSEDAAYREAVINDAEADVSTLSTLGMTECGNEASRSPGISTLSTLSTRVPSEYAELLSGLRDGAWLDQQTF